MASELEETPQRWTAKRRAALVLSILKGETSAAEAARKHGLTVAQVEEWREAFLLGAENALRRRPRDDEALTDEQITRLKQKVGELVLDLDFLQEASTGRPVVRTTSDACGRRARPSPSGGAVPGADDVVGGAVDRCPRGRRRADQHWSRAGAAARGAVAERQFRVGQRSRQSVCQAAPDGGSIVPSARPAAVGVPGGRRASRGAGQLATVSALGTPGG